MSDIRTVSDFAKRWMLLCPRRSPKTCVHNDSMLKRWVADFGDLPIAEPPTPLDAQAWCLADPGNLSSARYVRTFYRDAMDLRLCDRNPIADMALVLDPGAGRREVTPPTLQEIRAIADAAGERVGTPFRTAILLAGATGIRQSELCALKVSMVQRVPYTLIRLPAAVVKGRQKHDRLLTFAPEVRDAERALLDLLPAAGSVFGVNAMWIRARWNDLRKEIGHEWTWHDLRHGAATWLLEAGKRPEDIALMLWGRRDTALLLSLYAHEDREAAAERLRGAG